MPGGWKKGLRQKILRKYGVGVGKNTLGPLPNFLRASPLLGLERVHILALSLLLQSRTGEINLTSANQQS